MKRIEYPPQVRVLIDQLRRLPGIGPRSAERVALWLIQKQDARAAELAEAITEACKIRSCTKCGFFSEEEECEICRSPERERSVFCVVERATDVLSIERTAQFRGLYHALGGRLSPLDHIGPEDLRIGQLVDRVRNEKPSEIILALSADVEGEATASYLAEILQPEGVHITRLAQGLPAGGGLDHADDLTLARALSGRRSFGQ